MKVGRKPFSPRGYNQRLPEKLDGTEISALRGYLNLSFGADVPRIRWFPFVTQEATEIHSHPPSHIQLPGAYPSYGMMDPSYQVYQQQAVGVGIAVSYGNSADEWWLYGYHMVIIW